jgi:hypothetical protein
MLASTQQNPMLLGAILSFNLGADAAFVNWTASFTEGRQLSSSTRQLSSSMGGFML